MPRTFRAERKNHDEELRSTANTFYSRQWDVRALGDVESIEMEYPKKDPALNIIHLLDYMGADKILSVDNPPQYITINERFISHESPGNRFSIRVDTGTKDAAEKEKSLNGYRNHGSFPSVYAVGKVWKSGDDFEFFHLVDFKEFLRLVDEEELTYDKKWNNKDGSKAELYDFDNLIEAGCIINSWGEGW